MARPVAEPLSMSDPGIGRSPSQSSWLVPGHDKRGAQTAHWRFAELAGAGALRSTADELLAARVSLRPD